MYDYIGKFDEWIGMFEDAVKAVREYQSPKPMIYDLMGGEDKVLYVAAYAYDAARDAGYGFSEADFEAHIDSLINYGLEVDADEYEAAVSLAERYAATHNEGEE